MDTKDASQHLGNHVRIRRWRKRETQSMPGCLSKQGSGSNGASCVVVT